MSPIPVLLDDDPTGAQLSGGVAVALEHDADTIEAGLDSGLRAMHVVTNSRSLPPREAHATTRAAASAVHETSPSSPLFLRGDSTLRGHLIEEYDAVRDVLFPGATPALLLVPAMPSAGRITRGGVQIMTMDDNDGLRIMGSAGFPHWPDFFDRLLECRERGARLCTMEAYQSCEPVVVPNRWQSIRNDPAWKPIHSYLRELSWNSFASIPLMIRGEAQGVLNAYFAPGQVVGRKSMEFLLAMAEQAAVAVDYATLLQREREHARREERQRLARDLHDSIVQQVFSISMQAKSISVLGERDDVVPSDSVRRIADEVSVLSRTVLTDLRAMVHELRPSSSAQLGLEEAVRALAESTENRTGLRFTVTCGPRLDEVTGDLAEDVYRIVAEAIHNVVKHAGADEVIIRGDIRGHQLTFSVADDGHGIDQDSSSQAESYGLTMMRERAEKWGGTVQVEARPTSGTNVRATIPLPLPVPD
jgi:signal transduction histidine kinase